MSRNSEMKMMLQIYLLSFNNLIRVKMEISCGEAPLSSGKFTVCGFKDKVLNLQLLRTEQKSLPEKIRFGYQRRDLIFTK